MTRQGRAGVAVDALAPTSGKENAAYPWDSFDPEVYVKNNYTELRDDDRRILQIVRDYFAGALDPARPVETGVDVGAGANLYPMLTMLPFCRKVVLWEYGRSNVAWLQREIKSWSRRWEAFWAVLRTRRAYREVDPDQLLPERVVVRWGNIFHLRPRQFDLGTMFFVAESISEQRREFQTAVRRFIGALRPGAPFAAAFMQDSSGYYVGPIPFPAVAVSKRDVKELLEPLADDVSIFPVRSEKPLRDGYHGMILALGKAGRAKS
ncbi:MAG: hypothetical protein J2P15_04880 [Micromonosporaceae bacterium]|nr:hypothetical protein [Micromonosporaceae bacterium]